MTTTERRVDRSQTERRWSQQRGYVYLVGIVTSLAATLCASLIEFVMLLFIATDCEVPPSIVLGMLGRVLLTHDCTVLPIMILVSLPTSAVLARKRLRKPEAWHAACVIATAGIVVGYGDIAQYEHFRVGPLQVASWHVFVATGICALVVLGGVRWIAKTRMLVWYRRVLGAAALAGVAVFAVAPFLLRGTPLAGPDAYRLSPSLLVDGTPRLSGPPNVLFIVMDTVRADHLSHHNHVRDTSPFLEALSQQGITFDRALSAGIETAPSHASMFTGLSVRQHGVATNSQGLDVSFDTLAERAQASGFQTVAFSCNPIVDAAYNLMQGFDSTYPVWATWWQSRSFLHHWMNQLGMIWPVKWVEHDGGAAMTSFLVAEWIAHHYDPDQPFLMFINYMEAHSPLRPPLSYRKRFLDAASLKRSYELERDHDHVLQEGGMPFILNPSLITSEDLEIYRALYDASIRYMDDRIRELFALLELYKMLDNTVVIIVSDHGEGLGSHGIFGHRSSVYDMLIHVPLTIYVPRDQAEPQRVHQAVSTAALFDVVCTAVAAPQCPDAKTLAQVLIDRAGGKPVVSECPTIPASSAWRIALAHGVRPNEGVLRSYRSASDATMKYILDSAGSEELYDIATDPGEVENIAPERPQLLQEYASFLLAWLEKTPAFTPESTDQPRPTETQRELLKSLGYVGS